MIHNAVDRAMQRASSYDQSEAYASITTVHTIYIDNSRISNIETKVDTGMMFRMSKDGKLGKASVSLNGEGSVDNCLRMADTVLGFSPVDDEFKGYAQPGQARIGMPDVWDDRVDSITPDDLREIAKTLIGECRVNIPRAQIRLSSTESHVMNGNGVDAVHRSTLVYGHFTSMTVIDHPGEGMEKMAYLMDINKDKFNKKLPKSMYEICNSDVELKTTGEAIGLLEVDGLVASIEGLDTMLKTAETRLVHTEKRLGGRLVTLVMAGNVSAIKAALESGGEAASKFGKVYGVQIIPSPHPEVVKFFDMGE